MKTKKAMSILATLLVLITTTGIVGAYPVVEYTIGENPTAIPPIVWAPSEEQDAFCLALGYCPESADAIPPLEWAPSEEQDAFCLALGYCPPLWPVPDVTIPVVPDVTIPVVPDVTIPVVPDVWVIPPIEWAPSEEFADAIPPLWPEFADAICYGGICEAIPFWYDDPHACIALDGWDCGVHIMNW